MSINMIKMIIAKLVNLHINIKAKEKVKGNIIEIPLSQIERIVYLKEADLGTERKQKNPKGIKRKNTEVEVEAEAEVDIVAQGVEQEIIMTEIEEDPEGKEAKKEIENIKESLILGIQDLDQIP